MIVPLLAPPHKFRHRTQSSGELINYYLVNNPGDDEFQFIAYPTPGAELFASISGAQVRGMYEWRGTGYVVVDNTFYSVTSAGTTTSRGTLLTSSGPVEFASIEGAGAGEICLVDGSYGYSYLIGTTNFARITDADFPNGTDYITAFDERFIVAQVNSSNWQISATADGRTWAAADVASKRSRDDKIVAPIYNNLYIWLFGEESAETWVDTGAADFPFERQPGLALAFGLIGPHAAVTAGNQIYWVGRNAQGSPLIYTTNGFQPVVISTDSINYRMAISTVTDVRTYNLTMEGHEWVIFTFPTADFTFGYDLTTQQWFELQSYNAATQAQGRHFATSHMLLGNQHIVGGDNNGNLYKLSFDVYEDAGEVIRRRITSDHLDFDMRMVRCTDFNVKAEPGVGLTSGQGVDPQIWLEVSKDFGNTWSTPLMRTLGALGTYGTRLYWGLLGTSRKFTFRLTATDPVPVVIYGARANFNVSRV